MLIPPGYFLEKKWLRTATSSPDLLKYIGVSRSTYERLWKGTGFCSLKTHNKLCGFREEAKRELGIMGTPPDWRFTAARPWRSFFQEWLPAAIVSRDHKLSYAVSVTLKVEDALYAFGQGVRNQEPVVESLPSAMGLPTGFIPEELEANLTALIVAKAHGAQTPPLPTYFVKVVLRTSLFALAAWEVAMLRARIYVANKEPFIHKSLPKMIAGRYVPPMRTFLEGLQQHYGLPTNKDLAQYIEVSTIDGSSSEPYESALRQIQEWKCGKSMPGYNTICGLAFKLAHSDERQQRSIILSYIKNRFVQDFYNECKESIKVTPQQFASVAELVGIFQEYPEWYALHEARHDEWIKQGATPS